jgi:hypothetical protein
LLYVNDLPNCMENSHAAMYADDTNITVRSSSLKADFQSSHEAPRSSLGVHA